MKLKNKVLKMKTEDTKNESEEITLGNQIDPQDEKFSSELHAKIWSVVSFEKIMQDGLSYDEAFEKMQKLIKQKVSGLCIITDTAAHRLSA